MFYFVGGAPRVGKSILGVRVAAQLRIGWISTDVIEDLLRFKKVEGIKFEWNATPEAISAAAEWFYPCLERFLWGINSMSVDYLVEGVDFLPEHVARLSAQYPIRSVFLGRSEMTFEQFDSFPGRSKGYSGLPEDMKHRFAADVPTWSEFIRKEADRFGLKYFDTSGDFDARLDLSAAYLTQEM
jgi:hypothetical protein